MRILALNYEFPPLGGGAGNATASICTELAGLGCEVAVLTSHFGDLPKVEVRDGYTVHRVRVLRRQVDQSSPLEMGSFTVAALAPALGLARRFKPDVVHVYFGMPTGPVGLAVKRLIGRPYLLSLRGGDVPGFLPGALGRLHTLTAPVSRWVWHEASAIVANSRGLRDLAQKSSPSREVEYVPNGIDLERYVPRQPTAPDGVFRLLFSGRLVEQKGVRYIIEALPAVQSALQRPVELVVAGAGPIEADLRAQAQSLGLEQSVRFLGWTERAAMPDLYSSADVFVFPSFEEGMPNVVLEAMASGLPLVATDIYGHRELMAQEDNALLTPTADSAAISAALIRIGREPVLRERLARRSRERAQAFTWRNTAQTYLALSEAMLRRRPEPQGAAADRPSE